jgi:hypothetical protein
LKYLRLLTILLILIIQIIPIEIQSAEVTDVLITAIPWFSLGILNFNIIYVSDQRLDLSWDYDPATTTDRIMIRAKYSQYPTDIPNINTAPTDGYLVYYGTGVATSDTSMDFNENSGMLYYKAWGQKADGTWIPTTNSGFKESIQLILLNGTLQIGLILLAMIAFLVLAFTFKKPIFLWFSSFMALLWGVLMNTNTTLFGSINYIWILIGAGLFLSFLLLTVTLKDKTEVKTAEYLEPDDIKEARIEREGVLRQFQSMRVQRDTRIVARNKLTGLKRG